jgi:1,4-dihydroxy-2-naphthoate octaprenyltransferase
MNPELHHKWNDVRDRTRGSDKEGEETIKENQQKNKVTLKQNKPR